MFKPFELIFDYTIDEYATYICSGEGLLPSGSDEYCAEPFYQTCRKLEKIMGEREASTYLYAKFKECHELVAKKEYEHIWMDEAEYVRVNGFTFCFGGGDVDCGHYIISYEDNLFKEGIVGRYTKTLSENKEMYSKVLNAYIQSLDTLDKFNDACDTMPYNVTKKLQDNYGCFPDYYKLLIENKPVVKDLYTIGAYAIFKHQFDGLEYTWQYSMLDINLPKEDSEIEDFIKNTYIGALKLIMVEDVK